MWKEIAREWDSSIVRIRKNMLANPRYQLRYKGHKISFSPGPILWGKPKWSRHYISIFIDHTCPGEINIDISHSKISRGISFNDPNFDPKFRVTSKDEVSAKRILNEKVRNKILELPSGEVYIRSGYLQYAESGFIKDKKYLKKVVERLIDIVDAIVI